MLQNDGTPLWLKEGVGVFALNKRDVFLGANFGATETETSQHKNRGMGPRIFLRSRNFKTTPRVVPGEPILGEPEFGSVLNGFGGSAKRLGNRIRQGATAKSGDCAGEVPPRGKQKHA